MRGATAPRIVAFVDLIVSPLWRVLVSSATQTSSKLRGVIAANRFCNHGAQRSWTLVLAAHDHLG
jgi:hypothetical protein